MRWLLVLSLWLVSSLAHAQEIKDIHAFATIPILHEGRIKPIDSFARAKLKNLSGHENLQGLSATQWLAECLFDPAAAATRPVFKIRNPEIIGMLGLEKKELYSFTDILPNITKQHDVIKSILAKPSEEWTQSQSDLILLQQEMAIFEHLSGSFSSLLPLAVAIPKDAPDYLQPFIDKPITYRDTLKFREQLDADLKAIIKAKGEDVSTYTAAEQTLAMLSFAADQLRRKNENNVMLKILPAGDGVNWLAPWSILNQGGNPNTASLVSLWQDLGKAETIPQWNSLTRQIQNKTMNLGAVSAQRINAEYSYNLLHPHEMSFAFYLIALVLASIGVLLARPLFLNLAGYSMMIGVIIHLLGIVARIYILQRPPVSTLYETTLFVGAIVVAYGLILWFRRRDRACLIGAGLLGLFLHILSFAKIGEGDSLVMLDAVLNTKFWLATHVLCITTGYAFCLIASAFAHYLLWVKSPPAHIQSSLMTSTLLALFFCTVGTILGGIWADQSWGRFWGWDPKENGAMLITLWLIWVIHGRISGQMGPLFFRAMLAYVSVIVALSWFGVNLLGVGLHSYGFTDNLALALGVFVALQTLLVAFLWRRAAYAA